MPLNIDFRSSDSNGFPNGSFVKSGMFFTLDKNSWWRFNSSQALFHSDVRFTCFWHFKRIRNFVSRCLALRSILFTKKQLNTCLQASRSDYFCSFLYRELYINVLCKNCWWLNSNQRPQVLKRSGNKKIFTFDLTEACFNLIWHTCNVWMLTEIGLVWWRSTSALWW